MNFNPLSRACLVTDAYVGANIRSAATVDGTAYWLGGSAGVDGGVHYATHASTGATSSIFTNVQNIRVTHIFEGQLFASTAAGAQPDGVVYRFDDVSGSGASNAVPIATAPAGTAYRGIAYFGPSVIAELHLE